MSSATHKSVKSQQAALKKEANILAASIQNYIEVKNAYEQCDPEIRRAIDDMVRIAESDEATADEKSKAVSTIVEALFPLMARDHVDVVERACRNEDWARAARAEVLGEEEVFAKNVQRLLTDRNMTQEQLAERAGVGQPAISQMLKRQNRPQQRTVQKIAAALGVPPEALWPIAR